MNGTDLNKEQDEVEQVRVQNVGGLPNATVHNDANGRQTRNPCCRKASVILAGGDLKTPGSPSEK